MLPRRMRTDGFIDPCIPTLAAKQPVEPDWVHEINHDGYRLSDRDGALAILKEPGQKSARQGNRIYQRDLAHFGIDVRRYSLRSVRCSPNRRMIGWQSAKTTIDSS